MRKTKPSPWIGLSLLTIACSSPQSANATKDAVPAPFQALYTELDQELSAAEATLPAPDSTFKNCAASAPSLYLAASFFGPAERGSSRWNDILTVLDGFQSLGVDSVSIMISFPNLTGEVTEPDTYAKFMGFPISPDDFAQWLAALLPELSRSKIKGSTRIGAGAGVWESDQYMQAFAKLRGLDYIDFHFYPMKLGSKDFVQTLLSWIDQVKKADPNKEIVISESWLYKHGAQDPKGVFDVAAHGRNTYDFWAPLDSRFLRLLDRIGRIKGVSVIAPYFSQYFFEMQAFDPKTPAKPWPACLTEEWQRAIASIKLNRLSPIGARFKNERESCALGS